MTVAALLLAAGRSIRFGADDKMAALLNGVPLALHAAKTLSSLPFASRFVVTNSIELDWSGWQIVRNGQPEAGMGHSIALGAAAARGSGATALLVALADMPFVPADHFGRLLACNRGGTSLAASGNGGQRTPPALFGAQWFDALETLSGDHGARALLGDAQIIEISAADLLDVDYREDLAAAIRSAPTEK